MLCLKELQTLFNFNMCLIVLCQNGTSIGLVLILHYFVSRFRVFFFLFRFWLSAPLKIWKETRPCVNGLDFPLCHKWRRRQDGAHMVTPSQE